MKTGDSDTAYAGAVPVLEITDLKKVREKGGMRFELHVPSFSVHAGEFVAVVGESGCGKSTLLDILGLVLRPDSVGRFLLKVRTRREAANLAAVSEDGLSICRRRDIGYVMQSGGLLPYLNVLDNIALPCRINAWPDTPALKRARYLAGTLGISGHLDKKPAFLSGGQRQRAAIARALVHMPGLVLADEPTAAVDHLTACEVRDAFQRAAAEQATAVVLVTHDGNLIRGRVDRTVTFALEKQQRGHVMSTLTEAVNA
ncbi:MAG: ATP-binding cassette domain-containing protein [Desulfovibrio sp.]|nr:ATP-binding cassette domain-containing protein [Desulfovibrio sp.]